MDWGGGEIWPRILQIENSELSSDVIFPQMWEYLRDSFNNFRFVPRAIASLNILMLKSALIRNKISKITIVKIQLDQKIKCMSNKK